LDFAVMMRIFGISKYNQDNKGTNMKMRNIIF